MGVRGWALGREQAARSRNQSRESGGEGSLWARGGNQGAGGGRRVGEGSQHQGAGEWGRGLPASWPGPAAPGLAHHSGATQPPLCAPAAAPLPAEACTPLVMDRPVRCTCQPIVWVCQEWQTVHPDCCCSIYLLAGMTDSSVTHRATWQTACRLGRVAHSVCACMTACRFTACS